MAIFKSNLEAFLFSLVITIIYFYSILLNVQQVPQIQKNLIKRILLICVFNYLPLLLLIVIKEPKKSVRSKFKIEEKNNNNNNININNNNKKNEEKNCDQ